MPSRKVIKESGDTEAFSGRKLRDSLLKSELPPREARDVARRVSEEIEPPVSTREIYRATRKLLRRQAPASEMRYSLKKAIYALGPTGYPFEKYISRVLEAQGFKVEVDVIVPGRCVSHEVDVLARKDSACYVVECKFHHNRKTISDVKTALYVYARFQDIIKADGFCTPGARRRGMLITNTRFTSEAIKYARCMGIEAVGWKHPEGSSLEQMIDCGRTYPVTVLPSVNRTVLKALTARDVVLARDVLDYTATALGRRTGLPEKLVEVLQRQAGQICGQAGGVRK